MTRPVALITGASEGIGAEFARVFAAKGYDLVLTARRRERLDALADEIAGVSSSSGARPLVVALDLALPDAAARLAEALQSAGVAIHTLVNNAGFGLVGRFGDTDVSGELGMIDLNVRALTALTHRFLPEILAARGGILNVASIAAFAPGPGMAVYYASKAFVLSFTEALAQELVGTGVKVSALCPGPIITGFQARAGFHPAVVKTMARAGVIPAREAAEVGYDSLIAGRRVVVPGRAAKVMRRALAWMPHAILLPQLLARQAKRAGGDTQTRR